MSRPASCPASKAWAKSLALRNHRARSPRLASERVQLRWAWIRRMTFCCLLLISMRTRLDSQTRPFPGGPGFSSLGHGFSFLRLFLSLVHGFDKRYPLIFYTLCGFPFFSFPSDGLGEHRLTATLARPFGFCVLWPLCLIAIFTMISLYRESLEHVKRDAVAWDGPENGIRRGKQDAGSWRFRKGGIAWFAGKGRTAERVGAFTMGEQNDDYQPATRPMLVL